MTPVRGALLVVGAALVAWGLSGFDTALAQLVKQQGVFSGGERLTIAGGVALIAGALVGRRR